MVSPHTSRGRIFHHQRAYHPWTGTLFVDSRHCLSLLLPLLSLLLLPLLILPPLSTLLFIPYYYYVVISTLLLITRP